MRDPYENDEETTMARGRSFAVGLLCGAAVGAAFGVLFAPQTGAATRRDLRGSAERLSRRAMNLYENASETVEKLAERSADALERTQDVASRIRA
jgi:gas vesicle protein